MTDVTETKMAASTGEENVRPPRSQWMDVWLQFRQHRGAMIGAGANVIGNIEIGAYSKVGAGSVVLKDVPAGCTMAGAPAQIVRIRPINDQDRPQKHSTH